MKEHQETQDRRNRPRTVAKVQKNCEQYVYSRHEQEQSREIITFRYMIRKSKCLNKAVMTTSNEEHQKLKLGETVNSPKKRSRC